MAPLSEFERQRQENIKRNQELLKKLDFDLINDSIRREVPRKRAKPAAPRRKPPPRVKLEVEPARRSRRIAGIKSEQDDPEEYLRIKQEEDERERNRKEMERLKRTRLFGDFNLIDLVTDMKLGDLKHEDKVRSVVKKEKSDPQVKQEENDADSNNDVLSLLQTMGDKFSAGDFYQAIRKTPAKYNDKVLEAKRSEFDNLHIHSKHDPLDIKITYGRITAINFHPAVTDRLVMAGDTTGNVGIWAVDSDSQDPAISILKPHGKAISKLLTPVKSASKIYTSSYDGSVRSLDLKKLESSELLYLNDPTESADYELGVSDINLCHDNPNILYMTTLTGNFYQHDLRKKFRLKESDLLRLHDKKIGGFSINPNASHQIATASLDRTLKIWDLRNANKANGAWSDYEDQRSPHLYGGFTSRLSISSVDWNSENRLVCNGYDDNINLLNLSGTKESLVTEWASNYKPNSSKKRKKTNDDEEEPLNNIEPFTKIRHNCQTGRWVSIIKARWQLLPEDGIQKFIIANMNRGLDIYDQQGQIMGHLADSVGAVPAVATMHPTKNWAVGGSASGKLYLFE